MILLFWKWQTSVKESDLEIKINDYYEPEHFQALNEDNYNLSRSCEYDRMKCTTSMKRVRFY